MKTKRNLQLAFMMVTILLMSSCATSYRAIKPELFKYPSSQTEDGIQIAYKYDVLRAAGNKRYSEKESNQGLRLIAIQIRNQSDSTIRLGRDCDLFVGDVRVLPMEPSVLSDRLKQKVWPYYFYLLMTFVNVQYAIVTPSSITTGSWPVGYVLGPGLTLLNVTKATSANRQMYYNLKDGDVWNRDILGGETVYGLIGLEGRDVVPIHIRKRK
jgi:hypothetical protein